MKLLVVSDTHLKGGIEQLPLQVKNLVKKVDFVIHSGDFVSKRLYNDLKDIVEIKAVRGNMDKGFLRKTLPQKRVFDIKDYKIGIIHGNQYNHLSLQNLSYEFPGCDLVIYGHTHRPCNKIVGKQIFFNPGSPTDKRLQEKYSYGIITLGAGIKREIIYF
ncbi:MAG: metallophosphoesterase family protein [bacterium]